MSNDVELSLKTALDSHPEDWAVRWLVVDKVLERGGHEEAAQLVNAAPGPPSSAADLHRLVEVGGNGSLSLVQDYVTKNPAEAYGHELLATLLEWEGLSEKAAQHRAVAGALSGQVQNAEAIHAVEPVAVAETQPEQAALQEASVHQAPIEMPIPTPEPVESGDWVPQGGGKSKKTGSKVTAILVAIVVHLVIGLIAVVIVIMPPRKDEPKIVAAIAPPSAKKQEMQKKNVVKQTKTTSASAAAAAPLAQLMRANATARISMPKVTRTSSGPLGMGDADFGSGGFGSSGDGLGMGASFFGGSSTGNRFLFILDHSASMTKEQVRLRDKEVERALSSLKQVEYQVILFAGGAYYAWEGWSNKRQGNQMVNIVTGPKGSYKFESPKKNHSDYDFRGPDSKLPKEGWLVANAANVKKTMSIIKRHPLFVGTDWELAFRIGHLMDPPPDVIFFMSDGSGGNSPPPILSFNAKHGKPVINTVAMQTTGGMREFAEIAKKTKGTFTIVDKKGKPIDGFEYIKSPSNFRGRL